MGLFLFKIPLFVEGKPSGGFRFIQLSADSSQKAFDHLWVDGKLPQTRISGHLGGNDEYDGSVIRVIDSPAYSTSAIFQTPNTAYPWLMKVCSKESKSGEDPVGFWNSIEGEGICLNAEPESIRALNGKHSAQPLPTGSAQTSLPTGSAQTHTLLAAGSIMQPAYPTITDIANEVKKIMANEVAVKAPVLTVDTIKKDMLDGVVLTTVEEAVQLFQNILLDEVVPKIESVPARMLASQVINSKLGSAGIALGGGFLLPYVENKLPAGNPKELAKAVSRMCRVRGFATASNFLAKTIIKPLTGFFIEKASQLPDGFKAESLEGPSGVLEGATDFMPSAASVEAAKDARVSGA